MTAAPFDLPAARALCDVPKAIAHAAARTLLPAALDEIERLRKALTAEMGARTVLRFEAVTALNEACAASYSDADRYVVQHDLLQAARCRARANAFNDAARIVDDIHRKDSLP